MDNHVHWLLTPANPKGLARLFQRVHTWWAVVFNRKHRRTGHLFQNRYHSSPLDEQHYWEALRYVELNPKKAGLVRHAGDCEFSSARQHLSGRLELRINLVPVKTRKRLSIADWRVFLRTSDAQKERLIRRASATSRPCGSEDWISKIESEHNRRLAWLPPGRPTASTKTFSAAKTES